MRCLYALFACLLPLTAALPAKTFSAVCPALTFDQRLDVNGDAWVTWVPHGTHQFEFVNVIISLESLDGKVLKERSYPMIQTANGMFRKQLVDDPQISEVLKRKHPNIVLKYMFTYCVKLPTGANADCNTETFLWEQAEWKTGEFPPCPTACGLPPSRVTRDVMCVVIGTNQATSAQKCTGEMPIREKTCMATSACVSFNYRAALTECSDECGLESYTIDTVNGCQGSDGNMHPIEACKDQKKPQPVVCPATPPCVTWRWVAVSTKCPASCGYPGGTIVPEAVCKGSDHKIDNSKCANMPRPPSLTCPATAPCVSYSWRAAQVECPEQCGYPGGMFTPESKCMRTDGKDGHDGDCENMPTPPQILCPATEPCVHVFWKALEVECPQQCGYVGSMLKPKAICMGSDGTEHKGECKDMPMPAEVMCPPTAACVSYHWIAAKVNCPTECGFPGGKKTPTAKCMGTDGEQAEDHKCGAVKPGAVTCPATFPCESFYWKSTELNCPTVCGQQAKMVKPEADCMDNKGRVQPDEACQHLAPLADILCPATPACVDFHWVQAGKVECSKECGQKAITYEAGQLGFEIKCVGSNGDVYPSHKCANAPKLLPIRCPATLPCEKATWRAALVECPTECGLPASVITPEVSCISTVEGVSSMTDGRKCDGAERPAPIKCPATTPCLLPKYCPAITYTEGIQRAGSSFHVTFTPTIPDVHKYHFEFIDVHIIIESLVGVVLPQQNYRMTQPMSNNDFSWRYTLPNDVSTKFLNLQKNGRMVYWFTYCVGHFPNNIDCDTERKYFYL